MPNYQQENGMSDFLMFNKLITTWLVRIVYWIMQIVIFYVSIMAMFVETNFNYKTIGDDDPNFLSGLLILILGSLILRIVTESIIVIFKICENTK